MTRLIIRAVPTRPDYIAYLEQRIPRAEWCMDETRNAMDTFLKALGMAGDGPAVHMEEDILLTQEFEAKLEAAIAERPGSLIQFFSMRGKDVTIGSRWDRSYMMNQCFYLPAGYSAMLREYWRRWDRKTEHPTGSDTMLNDWLHSRKEAYWIHCPSLVDHRVCQSQIDPRRSSKRQSKTFTEEWK